MEHTEQEQVSVLGCLCEMQGQLEVKKKEEKILFSPVLLLSGENRALLLLLYRIIVNAKAAHLRFTLETELKT